MSTATATACPSWCGERENVSHSAGVEGHVLDIGHVVTRTLADHGRAGEVHVGITWRIGAPPLIGLESEWEKLDPAEAREVARILLTAAEKLEEIIGTQQ